MEGTAGTHLVRGWCRTGHGETPRRGSHGLGAGAVFPGDIVFPSHPSSPGRRRQLHAHPLCEEAPSRLATGRPEPPLPRNSARRIFSDASGNRVRGGGENRRPAPDGASVNWWGSTGFGGRRGMGERGSGRTRKRRENARTDRYVLSRSFHTYPSHVPGGRFGTRSITPNVSTPIQRTNTAYSTMSDHASRRETSRSVRIIKNTMRVARVSTAIMGAATE